MLNNSKSSDNDDETIEDSNRLNNCPDKEPNSLNLTKVDGEYSFKEGETFKSYEELINRLEKYQKEVFVYYWRRDSRTVERAYTKTCRIISNKLKYYAIHYACIYGGQKFQTRASGKRSNQRLSNRVDCPANIFLRANKSGKELEVTSVFNYHNHEISEELSKILPQNRKISNDLKNEVSELLNLKVDKKKIIDHVWNRENKNIKLKDLFNLAARRKLTNIKIKDQDRLKILENIYKHAKDENIKEICHKEFSTLINNSNKSSSLVESSIIQNDNVYVDKAIESISTFEIESTIYNKNFMKSSNLILSNTENLMKNTCKYDISDNQSNNQINKSNSTFIFDENLNVDEEMNSNRICGTNIEISENENIIGDNLNENDNFNFILYETVTQNIDELIDNENTLDLTENFTLNKNTKKTNEIIKKSLQKSKRKILRCRKCGSNAKLIQMQIKYLKAQRDKLIEETKLIKAKRKTLLKS